MDTPIKLTVAALLIACSSYILEPGEAQAQSVVNYNTPDRRPFGQLILSNPSGCRTQYNPRAYFTGYSGACTGGSPAGTWSFDATAGNWSPTNFAAAMQAYVTSAFTQLNSLKNYGVSAQGVIVWDLVGQEINQSFSYVGHPSYYSSLAPEMAALCAGYLSGCTGSMTFADWFIAQFQGGGYKVAMTLRPQSISILNASTALLPCTYNSTDSGNNDQFGYYPGASWPVRGYACQSGGVWATSGTQYGPDLQQTVAEATELNTLETDMSYAFSRWGIAWFYIDTFYYWNGSGTSVIDDTTLASLLTYCQGLSSACQLDPEQTASNNSWLYSMPYTNANNHPEGTPASVLAAVGSVSSLMDTGGYWAGGTCGPDDIVGSITALGYSWGSWTANVRQGSILMFRAWFAANEIPCVALLYLRAHSP